MHAGELGPIRHFAHLFQWMRVDAVKVLTAARSNASRQ